MQEDLQKLVKLYTKAQEVTTRKKAKKILKKAQKLNKRINSNDGKERAPQSPAPSGGDADG